MMRVYRQVAFGFLPLMEVLSNSNAFTQATSPSKTDRNRIINPTAFLSTKDITLSGPNSKAISTSTTSLSADANGNEEIKNANARTALDELSKDGAFKRTDAAWRNWISREEGAKFPPTKDRYHLFVAYACPWAHRTLITRALKGLEDVISVTVVQPVWQRTKPDDPNDKHCGWIFADPTGESYRNTIGLGGPFPASYPSNSPNPLFESFSVRDIYDKAGDTNGKYSVPILWDKELNTIVSNESAEIIRMLNSEFNEYAKYPDVNLHPEELWTEIDSVNDWVYNTINNGVYRCGFATKQGAYNKAITELTNSFDRVETILQKQRYIAGDRFTEADIRLFVTLLRFDEVYTVYFKTNTRSVANSSTILNYCREIYQMPGVKDTIDMEQIKTHYYASHPDLNKFSIIPMGNNFEDKLKEEHDRDILFPLS